MVIYIFYKIIKHQEVFRPGINNLSIYKSADFLPEKQMSDIDSVTTLRFEVICGAGFFSK